MTEPRADDPPLVLHVFDGFRVGGTEVRTCQIINYLGGAYRHVIISCNGDFSAQSLVNDTIDVEYFHPSHFAALPRWRLLPAIARYLRLRAPALLVAYEWGAIDWVMANVFAKVCPTLMTIEGFEDAELFAQKKTRWLLRRLFYRHCEKVVVCSRVLCRLAVESWKISDPGHVLHIPNGINCSRFFPAEWKEQGGREFIRLGIVASLIPLKNHRRLLRVVAYVAQHVELKLTIVGDGPERLFLHELCAELAIEALVVFTGAVKNPAGVLREFDIFCLTSDTEQMPMVVLEAMATGLPIVSTDVGDVREMVCAENRQFVVPKEQEEKLGEALLQLCRNQPLRQAIGRENVARCRQLYDEQIMFQRYRELYGTLMAG